MRTSKPFPCRSDLKLLELLRKDIIDERERFTGSDPLAVGLPCNNLFDCNVCCLRDTIINTHTVNRRISHLWTFVWTLFWNQPAGNGQFQPSCAKTFRRRLANMWIRKFEILAWLTLPFRFWVGNKRAPTPILLPDLACMNDWSCRCWHQPETHHTRINHIPTNDEKGSLVSANYMLIFIYVYSFSFAFESVL